MPQSHLDNLVLGSLAKAMHLWPPLYNSANLSGSVLRGFPLNLWMVQDGMPRISPEVPLGITGNVGWSVGWSDEQSSCQWCFFLIVFVLNHIEFHNGWDSGGISCRSIYHSLKVQSASVWMNSEDWFSRLKSFCRSFPRWYLALAARNKPPAKRWYLHCDSEGMHRKGILNSRLYYMPTKTCSVWSMYELLENVFCRKGMKRGCT